MHAKLGDATKRPSPSVVNDLLQDLICRSAPLGERLGGGFSVVETSEAAAWREEQWRKWTEVFSRDNPAALVERLRLSGIDAAAAKSLLGEVIPVNDAPTPRWAQLVWKALHLDVPATEPEAGWDAFHRPFIATARELLREMAGESMARLCVTALSDLERVLRDRLNSIASRALDIEFALHRASNSTALDQGEFAKESLRDGRVFHDYPVAARLIGLAIEFWVETVTEFLQRLEVDQEAMAQIFGDSVRSRISGIKATLSDPHRRGRSVFVVLFSDDFKLVYKPRGVGLEARWFEFEHWLNVRGCPVQSKIVCLLDRGSHGWMEFVSHEPCATEAEVEHYFLRAGGLLALLYALAGSDMHFENLVAHGSYPVPVDLEVLMMAHRGNPNNDANDGALEDASQTMRHSVLNVGLLPSWVNLGKGKAFNLGGLGANEKSHMPGRPDTHRPQLDGKPVSSHLYRECILKGFRAMYTFLLRHREAIMHRDGPLESFRGATSRFVNRATSVYARALRRGAGPATLASGAARSMEFEVFMKSVLHAPSWACHAVSRVTTSEILAMEQGDVPFFQGRVDSCDLHIPETGAVLRNFFHEDGFAISRARFLRLSSSDLELQTKLIGLSFDLMGDEEAPEPAKSAPNPFPSPSFREEAFHLAKMIREEAIRSGNDVTWIAPQMIPGTDHFSLNLVGASLYDGSLGVMLFLLAMEARLGDKASGDLGRQVFASFRRRIGKSAHLAVLRQQSLGVHGLGGQIYALLAGARLADNTDMLATAVEIGGIITNDAVAHKKEHDIMAGLAGAIPALLALHRATGDAAWLRKAVACGERLLANRELAAEGHRSWKVFDKFLAGYSHGAAGCAASLLRLHAACPEEKFQSAAREAIAYENSLFDVEESNWKDLRFEDSFMAAWCHGAPGILLGRLLGGERDSEDVQRALKGTVASGFAAVDQCCCGNAGKADVLLYAAEVLKDDASRDEARILMEQSIARARRLGGYRCYGKLPHTVRGPGLFQGFAGIGYTLLRLEFPLPSVLGMEI